MLTDLSSTAYLLYGKLIKCFEQKHMLSTFKNANISNVYNSLTKHNRHLKI